MTDIKSVIEYQITIDAGVILYIPNFGEEGTSLTQATKLFDSIAQTDRYGTGYVNLFAIYDKNEDRGVILKQHTWDRK